jgi:hypothetical protein
MFKFLNPVFTALWSVFALGSDSDKLHFQCRNEVLQLSLVGNVQTASETEVDELGWYKEINTAMIMLNGEKLEIDTDSSAMWESDLGLPLDLRPVGPANVKGLGELVRIYLRTQKIPQTSDLDLVFKKPDGDLVDIRDFECSIQ